MKRALQLVGWAAATSLLIYFLSQIDRAQLVNVARVVRWRWIAVAIIANSLILVSWAGLWWTLAPREERVKYSTMFGINAIASALMNTVPFLGGHAAAVVLLVKRGGMTRHGALSVMALDQLGEGMAKITVFGLVAAVAPIPQSMRYGIAAVCVGVGALLIGLMVAAHGHVHLRPNEDKTSGVVGRARTFAAEWASRMDALRSVKQSTVALLFAIGTKAAEGTGLVAVQYALGVNLSLGATALVLAAVMLGSILPVAPGNAGTWEAGAFLAYRHLGIEPGMATILAVASHICFMIPSVGIGYAIGSWRLGIRGLAVTES